MLREQPSRQSVAARRHAPSFFERDAPPVEETPQRPDADADAAYIQLLLKLGERDVRRLGDLTKEERRFGFYTAGLAIAALPLCRDIALVFQPGMPADRTRCAYPEPGRRLAARKTLLNGIHHTAAKINRVAIRLFSTIWT